MTVTPVPASSTAPARREGRNRPGRPGRQGRRTGAHSWEAALAAAICLGALAGCGSASASSAVTADSQAGALSSGASSSLTTAPPAAPSTTAATPSAASAPAGNSSSAGTQSSAGTPEQAAASSSGDAPTQSGTTSSADVPVQIVVIGDSLTSGYATPGYPWTIPAQQIFDAADLPAHIVNSSVPGIGYATTGGHGVTFADLVREVVTPRTNIVVLFGSDNDTLSATFESTVRSTVRLAQQLSPGVTVVIVGPPVTPAQGGADLSGMIAALHAAATATGASFVDASEWFEGKASQVLSSDQEHPNAAGEDFLGRQFANLLEPLIRARLHDH